MPDGALPGLYLVVQPSGAKSWAVRYRANGKPAKLTIGRYPAIGLPTARDLARAALRSVAQGRDPGREKKEARAAKVDSFKAVAAQFIERCKRANRPRTAEETERLLRLHVLPQWSGRAISEITRRDVLEILDRVVAGGAPVAANRTFTAVRALFNWAIERELVTGSPCAGVRKPTAERPRDRVLNDAELSLVWKASESVGWPFGTMVQLLALTGQRRDEVARMAWREVNFDGRLWMLPRERVKTDQPHDIPLSDAAVNILQSVPKIAGSPYVFTTIGSAPASNYSEGKRRLDALLPVDMPAWRLHDLRRTVASGMARLGVNLPVIEKVLNHTSGSFAGIVGVYQKHSFADEKRAALDAWGRHVASLA